MISLLIFVIAVAVLVALFIGKNLDNACPIWFFKNFEPTNIVVIVFFAFAAGIVFALICFLIGKIIKESRAAEETEAASAETKKSRRAEKKLKKAAAKAEEAKKNADDKKDKLNKNNEEINNQVVPSNLNSGVNNE